MYVKPKVLGLSALPIVPKLCGFETVLRPPIYFRFGWGGQRVSLLRPTQLKVGVIHGRVTPSEFISAKQPKNGERFSIAAGNVSVYFLLSRIFCPTLCDSLHNVDICASRYEEVLCSVSLSLWSSHLQEMFKQFSEHCADLWLRTPTEKSTENYFRITRH